MSWKSEILNQLSLLILVLKQNTIYIWSYAISCTWETKTFSIVTVYYINCPSDRAHI